MDVNNSAEVAKIESTVATSESADVPAVLQSSQLTDQNIDSKPTVKLEIEDDDISKLLLNQQFENNTLRAEIDLFNNELEVSKLAMSKESADSKEDRSFALEQPGPLATTDVDESALSDALQAAFKVKSEFPVESQEMHAANAASNNSAVVDDKRAIEKIFANNAEHSDEDALSTLASAALGHNECFAVVGQKDEKPPKQEEVPESKPTAEPTWYDVGIIKGTSCVVKNFYHTDRTNEYDDLDIEHIPDFTSRLKIDLEPGTAYKFRIAAINSCGRGEWSDVSAFKTCLPGYPGAPSAIKISKSAEGAHLSWDPPPSNSGTILEYSVCLAVKSALSGDTKSAGGTPAQLAFVRVYCGSDNQADVSTSSLAAAYIDTTVKPAIIFRIAAKNEKGYGPATQVRWLQDGPTPQNKQPQSSLTKKDKLSASLPPAKRYKTNN